MPTSNTLLPTSSSISTVSSPATSSGNNTGKAWIAGAVVGPVAGIGLCAAGYWLWVRRRKQRNREPSNKEEADIKLGGVQSAGCKSEFLGDRTASPSMLHGASAQSTPELPS